MFPGLYGRTSQIDSCPLDVLQDPRIVCDLGNRMSSSSAVFEVNSSVHLAWDNVIDWCAYWPVWYERFYY